jgi:hypothetical protein
LRRTLARRGTRKLIIALSFFLESEYALAQAGAAPNAGWRVSASYGQASAPRSEGFAEQGSLMVAHDSDLGSGFTLGIELTPLFVVNQTRVDLPGRPREVAYAVAVVPVLAWTWVPKASRLGLRLEGGVGIFWGFSPIPAEGSRFNFHETFSGLVLVRAGRNRLVSAGIRRAHVSNLGVVGPDNPGLSFYSVVAGVSWLAR